MISFLYILLSILGLSFLIFIHELGHYYMARRVGMRVETFSIGFGRPLFSWEHQGVKWQIGWLLFGGYVKIAGSELEESKDPYEIKDGFFGKSPIDRIKVSAMGPIVNLVFALLAFTLLWGLGGRTKNFSEYTQMIGWVDPQSELFAAGVRPGDQITAYDEHQFQGAKDNLYGPMTSEGLISVHGNKIDYATGEKIPFEYKVNVYPHPESLDKGIKTAGILNSANYIIYNRMADGQDNPLPEGSPLIGSGIEYGDRIFWVDGEVIYSLQELNQLLSGNHALLTVQREGRVFLARVPRVQVQELRPNAEFKEELTDWQFAAKLQGTKIQNLYTIPYNITNGAVVENPLKFIDKDKETAAFPSQTLSALEKPLQPGDKIIAINGAPIQQAYELLEKLQNYQVLVIVERNSHGAIKGTTETADQEFINDIHWQDLQKIVASIGTDNPIQHEGKYFLLKPITPKPRTAFVLSPERQAQFNAEHQEQKKAIESIDDPDKKQQAIRALEKQDKRLLLGLPSVQDRKVEYNPGPFTQFGNVFEEIWRTLTALVSGSLNPKWIAGPIGIVQMVHDTSMSSLKEALYWLGAISLNLGILNLLPIPVLDGGTILMSLLELASGKRMKPKTMEKLIIPFAVLLIVFFVYLTYNDLLRLFGNLLN